MKKERLPGFERLMIFSALISFGLLFYRCVFTLSFHYTYFLWNLLIAYVPYIISKQLLKCKDLNGKSILLVTVWLLFFPACVYLLTDILEMHKTDHFPVIYDAILYMSFAWNALLPALMSLKNVEMFLRKRLSFFMVKVSILFFIFLSSYGICVVRFLHLKNWDVVTNFKRFLQVSANHILNPTDHIHAWLSIISLMLLLDVIYVGFKKLYYLHKTNQTLLF
ncbi:MAG TPA: DUF1361 domain-containing protein [Parafilimonas sp.]|nr:DUF1361 domain-containing protein [Parafilimonas sp.]